MDGSRYHWRSKTMQMPLRRAAGGSACPSVDSGACGGGGGWGGARRKRCRTCIPTSTNSTSPRFSCVPPPLPLLFTGRRPIPPSSPPSTPPRTAAIATVITTTSTTTVSFLRDGCGSHGICVCLALSGQRVQSQVMTRIRNVSLAPSLGHGMVEDTACNARCQKQ